MALMTDIQSMFHQVRVSERQVDFLFSVVAEWKLSKSGVT